MEGMERLEEMLQGMLWQARDTAALHTMTIVEEAPSEVEKARSISIDTGVQKKLPVVVCRCS
jgi:hypothetical protein